MSDPVLAAHYRALLLANADRPGAPVLDPRGRVLVVDPARQHLGLLEDGRLVLEAVISTAANGLCCEENAYSAINSW